MTIASPHGNPRLLLPTDHEGGYVELRVASGKEPIWRSHGQPREVPGVTVDVWDGLFLGAWRNRVLLPPGTYRSRWRGTHGGAFDLPTLSVEARTCFEDGGGRWILRDNGSPVDGEDDDGAATLVSGRWSVSPAGARAEGERAYLFREAAMHGELHAVFRTESTGRNGGQWGLIARHYNAFFNLRVTFTRDGRRWQVLLERRFGSPPDEAPHDVLAACDVEAATDDLPVQWRFNGSEHEVTVNGEVILHAHDPTSGGVDVVGAFADPGTGDLERWGVRTTQPDLRLPVRRDTYRVDMQPGNIRALTFSPDHAPAHNPFWESGIQYGHIGGSEIKFTLGARQQIVAAGDVATVVTWEGAMPKFVEQAHDVRGRAWGAATFYDDGIVIDDHVLTWVRRSVGPDLDVLGRRMDGPARIACGGESEFEDWELPAQGEYHFLPRDVGTVFPVALVLPFRRDGKRWWLEMLVLLRCPQDPHVQHALFAWQCPRGLTASHDVRVAQTVPGQEYAYTHVVNWQTHEDRDTVEAGLLERREAWLQPMAVTASAGTPVRYDTEGEHPREAMDFSGCFDRASGRYVLAAEAGRVEAILDPGTTTRHGVAFALRGMGEPDNICVSVNGNTLRAPRDFRCQPAPHGETWIRLARPIRSRTTLVVAGDAS